MVRVLKCHNFRSQKTVPVDTEPLCLTSGRGKIFVGTATPGIDVFSVKREPGGREEVWELYCRFQTGAQVSQIEYNDTGDYVATVERKVSRRSEVVSVKVYLNWSIAHTEKNYRTRVRVASLGYRSTKVNAAEQRLEVLDVTCEKPARYITTCQQTGNLVIALDTHVKLYHLVEKTIPNSDTTFLDIVLFLELEFQTAINRLSLCEDFLACSSKDFVQIFQIDISNDATPSRSVSSEQLRDGVSPRNRRSSSAVGSSFNLERTLSSSRSPSHKPRKKTSISEQPKFSLVGERSSSTPSPALSTTAKVTTSHIEDDECFVHWTFDSQPPDKSSAATQKTDNHDDITLHLASLDNLGEDHLPDLPPPKFKDHIGGGHSTTGKTTLTPILHRYLDKSDHSWIQLQLIPTYLVGKQPKLTISENPVPVRSGRRASLIGMCCLMSGARVGFLFSLMRKVSLLSMYRYVSDAIQVVSNGHLVFVVTENGLQTYTSHAYVAVLHETHMFDNITQACPPPTMEICVCGAEKFMGAWDITLTDKHVIILSKIESSWGVYALEDISPAEFYNDIVTFGSRYQQNAPDTYIHLLLEGHMILRSQLVGYCASQSEVAKIQKLLCESSALLGEYYAMPECPDWFLCLPYYLMSKLTPMEVVRLQYRQQPLQPTQAASGSYGQGLVQYLKYVLFLEEDPLDLKPSDCDLILSICLETMPEKVSAMILFSRVKNFTPDKALSLLQRSIKQCTSMADTKLKTLDMLAMVSLHLQMCEPEIAMATLSSIDRGDLIEACVNYHRILHTNYLELSPLSQMLRCNCPTVLIEVLVILHDRGTVPMDLAVQLLQGRSGVPELHKNTHVREYLELLVNEDSRKFCFEEAAPLLCEIYIQRLEEWEPPSIRQLAPSMKFRLPSGNGHFARRHGWLDLMTPFAGARSITSPCRYLKPAGSRIAGPRQLLQCQRSDEACSCFLCNEDLLKLQSLLCYKDTSKPLCEKVLKMLDRHQTQFFYYSVYLLCTTVLNIHEAIAMVTEKHPNIAAEFGSSMIKHNHSQWEALLNSLLSTMEGSKQLGDHDDRHAQKMMTVTEVLRAMVNWLDPATFIKVLPSNGNFFFFLPYIQLCMASHKGAKLKQKILTLGEHIAKV